MEAVSDKKFIQKAIKKPGALRKSLGIKKGEKIPASKLKAAAKKKGKMGQRARLAITLGKLRKKIMAGIFGVALRGLGMLGKRSARKKISPTIKSVKPNVPKTRIEKAKSKLAIAKQKTKASQARLDNTRFRIEQQSKRLKGDK